jgi:hypothetical protein
MDLYLFGAGASAAEGAPATSDLFLQAWRRFQASPDARIERIWRFLEAVWGVRVDRPEAFQFLPHVDDVISIVDWSMHMEQGLGANYDQSRLWLVQQDLAYLLCATLEAAIASGHPRPGGPHDRFARALQARGRPAVLLSLNYDTLLDRALGAVGAGPDYGIGRLDLRVETLPETAPAVPLLKLHGSLNWARCPACDRIAILDHPLGAGAEPRCARCGSTNLARLVISPTWLKRYTATQLRHIWDLALESLQQAERLFVIGYSLPPHDVAVAHLLRRGLLARPGGRPLPVRVINRTRPGPLEGQRIAKATLAARFTRHLGPHVSFDWTGFHGQVE